MNKEIDASESVPADIWIWGKDGGGCHVFELVGLYFRNENGLALYDLAMASTRVLLRSVQFDLPLRQ